MPWQGVSLVDLRMRFVTEYLTEHFSMTELAASYGISRKTAYYWVRHYKREGPGRLAGASRRPHRLPRATAADIVARVLAVRRNHPFWGAGKIRDYLTGLEPTTAWPCRDTIHTVLVRAGSVRQRRRTRVVAPAHHLEPPTQPNETWTADFKGQFPTGDGVLCYPFTLRDGYSRFVLRCTALTSTRLVDTQAQFARAFAEYGLPERIRTDNGPPFAGSGLAGLSRLAVWWLRLAILPEHSRPGRPGDNGSHEQFHRVLKQETAWPPARTRAAQQRRFAAFIEEYNEVRPHDAVGHAPPATRYTPSPRPFPRRLPPLEYAADALIRRVSAAGRVKWRGRNVFLSEVLDGQDVAFVAVEDGVWLVYFAALPLAIFHERTWRLESPSPTPPAQGPGS
jgi:transposase InsO family protein